jgi:transcriptional regulator with XRE-family HTH domain
MNYGERLRYAREKREMTQEELAAKSKVGQGSISKIERGDQEKSTHDIKLAFALQISPFWLAMEIGEMELYSLAPSPLQRQILEEMATFEDNDIEDILDEIKKIKRRRAKAHSHAPPEKIGGGGRER